jgi:hypothetical protein
MSGPALLDSGIRPNTVRLSIGTEHIDDLWPTLRRRFKTYASFRGENRKPRRRRPEVFSGGVWKSSGAAVLAFASDNLLAGVKRLLARFNRCGHILYLRSRIP